MTLVAGVTLLAVSGCSGSAALPVAAPERSEAAPVVAALDTGGTEGRDGGRPPAPAALDPPPEAIPAPAAPEPTRVLVTRLGVDHPLTPVGLHPDQSLVVPDEALLAGWYTGAPRPGEVGPSVLVGHNSWGGVRGVFHRLHELLPGDEVAVAHDDGSVVRFTVERVEQHPKAAFPTERVYGNTDRQEVRIITCGGAFDRARGRYLDNVVVFAVRAG